MDEKAELLPLAFKQARGLRAKIAELGITPSSDDAFLESLAEKLAQEKAERVGGKASSHLSGQIWYMHELVRVSGLTKEDLFEECYNALLIQNSSREELISML